MIGKKWFIGSALCILLAFTASIALADGTLDKIKQAGKIVIGVKADYPPWGFRDKDGKLTGMEIELAHDVAKRLGVKLKLVPVQTANRMQFLQQGKINLIIATMSDNAKREKAVGTLEPYYYASGVTLIANKKYHLKGWDDVKGKPVCGLQGHYANKTMSIKHGYKQVNFPGIPQVEKALMDGRCVAWMTDDANLITRLPNKEKWGDYEMAAKVDMVSEWTIAVPLKERHEAFGKWMSGVITEWLKSGYLLELEKKWGIPTTDWLTEQSEKFGYSGN